MPPRKAKAKPAPERMPLAGNQMAAGWSAQVHLAVTRSARLPFSLFFAKLQKRPRGGRRRPPPPEPPARTQTAHPTTPARGKKARSAAKRVQASIYGLRRGQWTATLNDGRMVFQVRARGAAAGSLVAKRHLDRQQATGKCKQGPWLSSRTEALSRPHASRRQLTSLSLAARTTPARSLQARSGK
jgi:hypothetical protein